MMAKIETPKINTSRKVTPMIYAYTTPGIAYHDGYIKIGYTEQEVDERIRQQTHTAGIKARKEWTGLAVFDDGSGDTFLDTDFHEYLRINGVKQPQDEGSEYFDEDDKNEWFHISPADSRNQFYDFRSNHGRTQTKEAVVPYKLREEQARAVSMTLDYCREHKDSQFLWNAKPSFGKTLSVYDFVLKSGVKNVLIVTNRPAIANSWYNDYARFLGSKSGYLFVSEADALAKKPGVLSRKQYAQACMNGEQKIIEFVSLQDMKGSVYFGGQFDKLKEVAQLAWDILVIDEAHEGVDTYKTDVAFEQIKRSFTLHLSGTPFKALANAKFADGAVFNWTYADEQEKKRSWDSSLAEENPYASLPQLNMYTYQMSEIVRDELKQGIEIKGETEEYAFDLNEFFSTNQSGKFVYDTSVDKFLDALTVQKKFPFSTPELRNELKHTFWLLDRVDSAKALASKLKNHPVFKDYEIVLAAGDGKLDDEEETVKSYDKVVRAIAEHDKTITLSVGQLTTGITVPEWTAVLMLSNVKSPSLYMQAAFRAQNPCLFQNGTECFRKENAYVFDFDPARTLTIFEEFANDLSKNTVSGRGDVETRKKNICRLLNFFPVIGEDEDGELTELDAEKVMTIPRKIRSAEVVKRGFMSNFLFQNISQVFGAPKAIMDIIKKFEPVQEPKNKPNLSEEAKKDLNINDNGEVEIPDEYVLGKSAELFGQKIYENIQYEIEDSLGNIELHQEPHNALSELQKKVEEVTQKQVQTIVDTVKQNYSDGIKKSDENQIESKLKHEADSVVAKSFINLNIKQNVIEQERKEALQTRDKSGKTTEEINKEFDKKLQDNIVSFKTELTNTLVDFAAESQNSAINTVATNIKDREKNTIEDGVRDHLRGFSRTIPSFLMAYGNDEVTLATFDKVIPDNVFIEVTSITLDQFRFLRDGGNYNDDEGNEQHFEGHLFDEVVFDDSVKEFLNLKRRLADYFDEESIEDIFDYIPPQKTNQIFTPKDIVKKMVDMLEEENPGCFDMSDKTFIDPYMKSGLYIAEIVKRLYQSPKLKELFPDKKDRLKHIFEKQVYGLAPTEIIYKIATSFILGFDEDVTITKHNFKQLDALPYAKDGTLKQKLDELFDGE